MFPVYGLAEASLAVTFPAVGAPLAVESLARGALGPGDVMRTVAADARGRGGARARGTSREGLRGAHRGRLRRRRVAPEMVGRILIRGDNVSPGYYDDPELTAASRTADGFLDTGDLGTIRDGELVVTGRIKEILFVAGQNHYPQDIDLVLAQHAGIELGRAAAAGMRPAACRDRRRARVRALQGRRPRRRSPKSRVPCAASSTRRWDLPSPP